MTQLLKPKDQKQPRRTHTKDGRLIESPYQYRKTKAEMWRRQGRMCAWCQTYLDTSDSGERHHPEGRGIGGSKRDDRKTVLICQKCHRREHEASR